MAEMSIDPAWPPFRHGPREGCHVEEPYRGHGDRGDRRELFHGGSSADDVGVARIALTGTPSDVACIGLTVVGARTVTRLFAASPGVSQTLTVAGLPLGADVFVGPTRPPVPWSRTRRRQIG